jgi:hypothetical protein
MVTGAVSLARLRVPVPLMARVPIAVEVDDAPPDHQEKKRPALRLALVKEEEPYLRKRR